MPATCTTIIIILQPCALIVEFQNFIPRLNKISLFVDTLKERFENERRFKDRVIL
jgi:hypothetical protein